MAQNQERPTGDTSQRTKVDWRGRQRNKRIFGALKLLMLAMFFGVLVGIGIVYQKQITKWLNPPKVVQAPPPVQKVVEPPKVEPSLPPPEIKPEPAKPAIPEVPVEPAKPVVPDRVVVESEEKKALDLIAEGRKLLEKLDFVAAKDRFQTAGMQKASLKVFQDAKSWAQKAEEFDLSTRHIKVSEFAISESACKLKMMDGRELRGLKISENVDAVVLQAVPEDNPATLGRSTFTIPKADVAKTAAVSLAERQGEFRELLSKLESGLELGSARAPDFYDLVFLAKRLNLGPECVEYLNRAFDRAPQGLANAFRKVVVDRALERAAILAAAGRKPQAEGVLKDLERTLSDYQVARDEADVFRLQVLNKLKSDFKSTLTLVKKKDAAPGEAKPMQSAREVAAQAADQGGNEEIVVDSSGVKGSGASAPLVDKANQKYAQGMATYKKFQQGTKGNNNQILQDALKSLEEAMDLYEDALKKDPKNRAIEDRMTEANMIAYACRKYQTLH